MLLTGQLLLAKGDVEQAFAAFVTSEHNPPPPPPPPPIKKKKKNPIVTSE
jgi:hypothetical protein